MKVEALVPVSTESGVHEAGTIFDASKGEAGRLVFLGFAREVKVNKPKQKGKKD